MTKTLTLAVLTISLAVVQLAAQQPQQQPRVFLMNNDSFEMSAAGGVAQGQVRPMSAEQTKDMSSGCPGIIITATREKADFVVNWKTKSWDQTSWAGHQNDFSVYNAAGDLIGTGQSHRASASAKDICNLIQKNWKPKEPVTK